MSPVVILRRAFTLVELLVVIAIIGVLVALLLPAVQSAREASRRTQCSNHLKQLGLALQNYHDQYRMFPAGGVSFGSCCGTPTYTGWAISILPMMENANLEDRYDYRTDNQDPNNQFTREQHVPSYTCPSDINPKKLSSPESGPGSGLNYAHGSYRGVAGISDVSCWPDNDQIGGGTTVCNLGRGPLHHVGTQSVRQESFATITDGSSNTLLVGEYHTRSHLNRRTYWAYSYASYALGTITLNEPRILLADYDKCLSIGSDPNPCKRSFSSFHRGVVQFCLVDASVRPLPTTINMTVLAGLATIQQGETVDMP